MYLLPCEYGWKLRNMGNQPQEYGELIDGGVTSFCLAEQFSWYICFGMIIDLSWSNPQGFYKEYKG
jgi:hypothetical protein